MEQSASERQFEVLRLYGELVSQREDWRSALVLACGAYAEIVPPAVSIANGATLWLTGDAVAAKAALRRGEVDFVVNSLEEALRTLKNQIRQGRPLGVALTSDVAAVLEEMVDRGVLPDKMFRGAVDFDALATRGSIEALRSAGMDLHAGPYRGKDGERWAREMLILHRERHHAYHVHASSLGELRDIDAQLLAILPEDDFPRRRWLERISRYLRDTPSGGRWVWLTEAEYQALPGSWQVSPEERP